MKLKRLELAGTPVGERAERRRLAVKAIRDLRGIELIGYDHCVDQERRFSDSAAVWPKWFENLVGIDALADVIRIEFATTDESCAELLPAFDRLEYLDFLVLHSLAAIRRGNGIDDGGICREVGRWGRFGPVLPFCSANGYIRHNCGPGGAGRLRGVNPRRLRRQKMWNAFGFSHSRSENLGKFVCRA